MTTSSQTEGRIPLALQALHTGQIQSIRAAATQYDVPYENTRQRRLNVPARSNIPANRLKMTPSEEELIVQNILQ